MAPPRRTPRRSSHRAAADASHWRSGQAHTLGVTPRARPRLDRSRRRRRPTRARARRSVGRSSGRAPIAHPQSAALVPPAAAQQQQQQPQPSSRPPSQPPLPSPSVSRVVELEAELQRLKAPIGLEPPAKTGRRWRDLAPASPFARGPSRDTPKPVPPARAAPRAALSRTLSHTAALTLACALAPSPFSQARRAPVRAIADRVGATLRDELISEVKRDLANELDRTSPRCRSRSPRCYAPRLRRSSPDPRRAARAAHPSSAPAVATVHTASSLAHRVDAEDARDGATQTPTCTPAA